MLFFCLHSLEKCIRVIPIWVRLFEDCLLPLIDCVYNFLFFCNLVHEHSYIPVRFSKNWNLLIFLQFFLFFGHGSKCWTRYQSTRFEEVRLVLWVFINLISHRSNAYIISLILKCRNSWLLLHSVLNMVLRLGQRVGIGKTFNPSILNFCNSLLSS